MCIKTSLLPFCEAHLIIESQVTTFRIKPCRHLHCIMVVTYENLEIALVKPHMDTTKATKTVNFDRVSILSTLTLGKTYRWRGRKLPLITSCRYEHLLTTTTTILFCQIK